MGEATNRRIKYIQPQNFYGNFIINILMKGKAVIEITPDGIKKNSFGGKTIYVPWSAIKTVFYDWGLVPVGSSDYSLIGITTTEDYACSNYSKVFAPDKLIRSKSKQPLKFSRGIVNSYSYMMRKAPSGFQHETVVPFISPKTLKMGDLDLFRILEQNLEITKTGYTY